MENNKIIEKYLQVFVYAQICLDRSFDKSLCEKQMKCFGFDDVDVFLTSVMYYLDFTTYRDTGKSFTGDVYVRTSDFLFGKSYFKSKEHLAIVFNKIELKLPLNVCERIQKIINTFKDYPAERVVNQIKAEAPYFYAEIGGVMDYKLSKDIDII